MDMILAYMVGRNSSQCRELGDRQREMARWQAYKASNYDSQTIIRMEAKRLKMLHRTACANSSIARLVVPAALAALAGVFAHVIPEPAWVVAAVSIGVFASGVCVGQLLRPRMGTSYCLELAKRELATKGEKNGQGRSGVLREGRSGLRRPRGA